MLDWTHCSWGGVTGQHWTYSNQIMQFPLNESASNNSDSHQLCYCHVNVIVQEVNKLQATIVQSMKKKAPAYKYLLVGFSTEEARDFYVSYAQKHNFSMHK